MTIPARRQSLVPLCAKCNKPVDYIIKDQDRMRDAVRYKVGCHGAEESMILTGIDMMECRKIESGIAFKNSEIEAPAAPRRIAGSIPGN